MRVRCVRKGKGPGCTSTFKPGMARARRVTLRPSPGLWIALGAAVFCAAGMLSPAAGPAADPPPLFYVSFDRGLDAEAAKGDPKAVVQGVVPLATGHTGQGAVVDGDNTLAYATKGNLDVKEGTVALWFKPIAPVGARADWDRLFDMHAATGNKNAIRILTAKNAPRFYAVIESNDVRAAAQPSDMPAWEGPDWRHVALTWGEGRMRLYLNGVSIATGQGVEPPDAVDSLFYVGSAKERHFSAKGILDDVYIFASPLSRAEICRVAGLPEPAETRAANLLPNSSFEVGHAPWIVWWQSDLGATWKVDETQAWHGRRSMAIDRTQSRGPGLHPFVIHGPWIELDPGTPAAFSVYAKADQPGASIRLKIQNGTKQNLLESGAVTSKGIEKTFNLTTEWQRCVIQGPLPEAYKDAYRVNVQVLSTGQRIWVDAAQFNAGEAKPYAPASAVELGLETGRFGNLFDVNERATLTACVAIHGGPGFQGDVECQVKDPYGKDVLDKTSPVETDSKGLARAEFQTPALALRGQYEARFSLTSAQSPAPIGDSLVFGVVRSHRGQPSPVESPFGVDAQVQNMEAKIPNMRMIGVAHVRQGVGMSWNMVEPKKDEFDYGFTPEFLRMYHDNDLDCLPMLGSTPLWAQPKLDKPLNWRENRVPPANLNDWTNYCRTVVERFKDARKQWAVWNEPNGMTFFSGTAQEFARLLVSANKTVKSVDPSALVVGCSMAGSEERTREWADALFAAGGLDGMDMLAFHPYKAGPPEDPEIHFVDDLRAMWDSERSGVGPDLQALIRPDAWYSPKKAVLAYNTLIWRLENARFERMLAMPSESQHGVEFRRKDGVVVTVLWDWRGPSNAQASTLGEGANLSDIWGNPIPLQPQGNRLALQLNESPIYLETRGPVSIQ